MPPPILLVFIKEPVDGAVKTRLAVGTSPRRATAIYLRMASMIVHGLLPSAGKDFTLWLYTTPAGSAVPIAAWLFPQGIPDGVRFVDQPDGPLEVRLEEGARQMAAAGAPAMGFLGTDCPTATREEVVHLFSELCQSPAVIGPTRDGGFWFLGLRKWSPGLFKDIPYSSPDTCARLESRLVELSMAPVFGPLHRDVDTVDDLAALPDSLRTLLDPQGECHPS